MQRQEEVAPRTKARLLVTQCLVLFLADAVVHRYQIPGSSAIEHRLGSDSRSGSRPSDLSLAVSSLLF